ncbi:serine hydrolase [Streptacidiphilus fuscans]|uniref:serine hydrolase n=1 Tax=Streptacidiphilus fuscans TaxID=2789292 RepID=UPI002E28DB1A|nr:serine hydrolase [Streptacidiphilus fuscans]
MPRHSPSATPTPRPTPTPSPTPTPTPTPTLRADGVDAALASADGHAAVAAVDLSTGLALDRGDTGHAFVTASIVKVDILATLLLQHQDNGTSLDSDERALAQQMIENSDNDAATSLFDAVGGASGVDAANQRFGLTDTSAGTGGYWGLTTTTARDQLTLLRQVFTSHSHLDSDSREYLDSLMSSVEPDQTWGVSAAADGGSYALKNGWLPRSATGLWVINSIGEVRRDGHTLLIAALSDDNPSMDGGVSLVQRVASAVGSAFD